MLRKGRGGGERRGGEGDPTTRSLIKGGGLGGLDGSTKSVTPRQKRVEEKVH